MKFIQIEETWINLFHITHFEFTPARSTGVGNIQKMQPAELAIEVVGNNPLRFFGPAAENGHQKLTEGIAG
jgi:hypothetical protein